jgi:hypothetical protein
VVATFLPKGNRIGEYPVNVLPIPKGEWEKYLLCFSNLI